MKSSAFMMKCWVYKEPKGINSKMIKADCVFDLKHLIALLFSCHIASFVAICSCDGKKNMLNQANLIVLGKVVSIQPLAAETKDETKAFPPKGYARCRISISVTRSYSGDIGKTVDAVTVCHKSLLDTIPCQNLDLKCRGNISIGNQRFLLHAIGLESLRIYYLKRNDKKEYCIVAAGSAADSAFIKSQ